MSAAASIFPPLLWCQRAEHVLITIPLQDAVNVVISLPEDGAVLSFSCQCGGVSYACQQPLFRRVAAEESSHAVRPRQIELKLKKVYQGEGNDIDDDISWPRLTKEKKKVPSILVDWARWVDADAEEEEAREMDALGDFGMSEDDLVNTLTSKEAREESRREAAEALKVDPDSFPGFGSAAGQRPLSEEEIMGAGDDDDDMPPPLEEVI